MLQLSAESFDSLTVDDIAQQTGPQERSRRSESTVIDSHKACSRHCQPCRGVVFLDVGWYTTVDYKIHVNFFGWKLIHKIGWTYWVAWSDCWYYCLTQCRCFFLRDS